MTKDEKDILEQWLQKASNDFFAPELSEVKDYYQIALTVKSLVLKKINLNE